MRVRSFIIAVCVLTPALTRTQSSIAQVPVKRLTTQVAGSVKKKEPDWRYVMGFCTCPPLLPSQISDDVADWSRKRADGKSEWVAMQIHVIGNQKEAIEFMSHFGSGRSRARSVIRKYELGDEAFLIEYSAGDIKNPSQMWMRKDKFIVHLDGALPATVIRFAQYALKNLPTN
jgi:hypothetical protein